MAPVVLADPVDMGRAGRAVRAVRVGPAGTVPAVQADMVRAGQVVREAPIDGTPIPGRSQAGSGRWLPSL